MRSKAWKLWILLWLGGVWLYVVVLSIGSGTDVRKSSEVVTAITFAFTALLALHASLYALNLLQRIPRRWHWLYVVGQSVVIISINFLLTPPNALMVTAALSLALIGEVVGTWREPGPLTFTVVSALFVFILSIALRVGWLAFHHVLLYLVPLTLVIVGYVVLYLRLTRAHERAEALLHELEAAHGALATYAARVEELTLANERQRLARELHDTLAQGLVGLTMQLDAVDALLSEENLQEAQEIVQRAMVRSRTTLADARKAIDDLRSSESDALTCCEAVQEEILHFTTATGIACHADLTALATVAPPFHAHVLRVVTEGLLNVARHAQAHQVWVRVIRQDGTSIVEIRDDGIGFDRPQEAARTGHYGLLGLRERARLIGGRLEVESASAMGTTIRFSLPSHEGEGRHHGVEAEGQHGASLTARDIRHG